MCCVRAPEVAFPSGWMLVVRLMLGNCVMAVELAQCLSQAEAKTAELVSIARSGPKDAEKGVPLSGEW